MMKNILFQNMSTADATTNDITAKYVVKSYVIQRYYILSIIFTITLGFIVRTSHAQDIANTTSKVITGEGISGDIDKKRRSPTVSVGASNNSAGTKILVDAYVADPEYQKYPIQFDFYINRKFFTSQIRSTELPGPIGIDIDSTVAATPFNYTIVARTLHPNREFTSVINGAVFSSDLSTAFDCTLTTGATSEDSIEYIANNVSLSQTNNNVVMLEFETKSTPEGHNIKASAIITLDQTKATANLELEEDDKESTTTQMTGDVVETDGKITAITLNTTDANLSLSCS